jgi:homospermidine synthase
MVKVDEFLLLGMGSIQRSLMELLNVDKSPLRHFKMTCICPEDIPAYIYKLQPQMKHIKKAITEDNMEKLLKPFMRENVFVVDLTVNTDSIAIMSHCKRHNVMYINTSIEEYHKPTKPKNPEKLTLYYQDIQLKKEMKDIKSDTTILHSMGLNSGAISSLALMAITEYCRKYKPEKMGLLRDGKYNLVCKDILEMIHIAEYDNQEIKQRPERDSIRNSWSAFGYISEALSPAFVSSPVKPDGFKKSKYNKYIYYNPDKHSMDCKTTSICLDPSGNPFEIEGRMITHFEVVSLSEKLGYGKYVPKISYVYCSSPISQIGLEQMRANDYKEPKEKIVFYQQDIINKDSFDSMGALCQFKDGRRFWCGTVLDNKYTMQKMGKNCYTNATQLQVSVSVLAGIEYMMKHKHEDTITSEEIPYNTIINRCKPYWGKFFCKEI